MKFSGWLDDVKDEITQYQDFSKSSLPTEGSRIQADLNATTTYFPRCAELLADVEQFILTNRAIETLAVKKDPKYEDLAAPERKTVVESRLSVQIRTRDILKATCASLKERSFALLNQRNYVREEMRMAPHGSGS